MPNRVEFVIVGMDELMLQLEQLPALLAREAETIVQEETEAGKQELIAAYPSGGTGNMREGVATRYERVPFGLVGFLESNTPEAVWWEFGTQDRRTREGWSRGRAPSHEERGLIAIGLTHQRRMLERVAELVRREGFQVDGLY
jgi:hypothetical protein